MQISRVEQSSCCCTVMQVLSDIPRQPRVVPRTRHHLHAAVESSISDRVQGLLFGSQNLRASPRPLPSTPAGPSEPPGYSHQSSSQGGQVRVAGICSVWYASYEALEVTHLTSYHQRQAPTPYGVQVIVLLDCLEQEVHRSILFTADF
jgi:hypothetical protein